MISHRRRQVEVGCSGQCLRAVNNLAVQSLVAAFADGKVIVDESSAAAPAITEVTTD